MMRRRHRRGRYGRRPNPVYISNITEIKEFRPVPDTDQEPITLDVAELEAMRLVDQMNLSQQEAGERMKVSRGTVWRLLQRGREKVVVALTEGRPILIQTEHEP